MCFEMKIYVLQIKMKGVRFNNLTVSTIQASASKQKAHRARESSVTFQYSSLDSTIHSPQSELHHQINCTKASSDL